MLGMTKDKAYAEYCKVEGWAHRAVVELPDNSYALFVAQDGHGKIGPCLDDAKLIYEDEHGEKE
jgi:hypothetical protein